jgi:hypothetical protein
MQEVPVPEVGLVRIRVQKASICGATSTFLTDAWAENHSRAARHGTSSSASSIRSEVP